MTNDVQNPPSPALALVAYDGVQQAAVLGLRDLFQVANAISSDLGGAAFDVQIVTPPDLSTRRFQAVILPPNLSGTRGQAGALTAWIVAQHGQGALLCSICAGAFWLAHAGVLSGRPATTHWALEAEFRAAFPNVDLHPEHLLVDDGDVVTAGGMMAWLDLGLHLVDRWLGGEVMSHTARHLLIDPAGREQRNYRSFRPRLDHGDARILAVQHWIASHPSDGLDVAGLAARAGQSERSFQRHFHAATGLAPKAYVQAVRVEKARGLLERTRHPVAQIAWQVGYQDVSAFARVFGQATGVTPGDYRTRFTPR